MVSDNLYDLDPVRFERKKKEKENKKETFANL